MTLPNKFGYVPGHFLEASLALCHIHIYMGGPYVAR